MLRFKSNYAGNGNGFEMEYKAFNFTCGGNFSNQSGVINSPLFPNPYPTADCVYLISQPTGTYVNISFLTMDIDCKENLSESDFLKEENNPESDYLEIRDGKSENSPFIRRLCGNESDVPAFITATQNHMHIRLSIKFKLIPKGSGVT